MKKHELEQKILEAIQEYERKNKGLSVMEVDITERFCAGNHKFSTEVKCRIELLKDEE